MGSVFMLRAATVEAKTFDAQSQKKEGVEMGRPVISLQTALEAENTQLRQLAVELLLDTSSLRQAVRSR